MWGFRGVGRLVLICALTLAAIAGTAAPAAAATTSKTEAQRIIAIAKSEVGARYSFAASGPNRFDCSGFVTYVFRQAGLLDRIGGTRRSVAGFYDWFARRGRASKTDRQPGDLIVWGRNHHIGIYIGDGMAVSALINPYGVKVHPVTGYLGMKVKAYLHVKLDR
jgi:cell wall-associated NlpC family hydrolase